MARVTYGSGVTELAGSIGGVTYHKNASGNIARLRPKPTVNPTSRQARYQRIMASLVSFWPTLSQANKDLWDAFATAHNHTTPWGEIKTLSGYQWFMSCNLYYYFRYSTIRSAPPTWFAFSPPNSFNLVATSTYLRLEWSPSYTFSYSHVFYCTLPLRQSSLKLRRSLFYIGRTDAQGPQSSFDITTWFESLANVTWSSFFSSANCSIICRLTHGSYPNGLFSSYTSAIVKI